MPVVAGVFAAQPPSLQILALGMADDDPANSAFLGAKQAHLRIERVADGIGFAFGRIKRRGSTATDVHQAAMGQSIFI